MVLCIVIGSMMPCFAWENIANLTTGDPWKFSSFDAGANTRAYILKGKSKSHNQEVSAHSVYFINAVYSKANDKESNYVQDTLVSLNLIIVLRRTFLHHYLLQKNITECYLIHMELIQLVAGLRVLRVTFSNKSAIFYKR